jgi:hypothetical protein
MEIEKQSANHVLFKSIGADVTQMYAYWKVYRQLFATNDERIALLNETGSMVFYMLQHLLIDEVTLSICRLTDPAETMRRKNHSIERLVADVQETALKVKLEAMMIGVREFAKPFRDRRNRAIAHSDLKSKLKLDSNPIPGISRADIEAVLKQIRDVMNIYDQHCFRNTNMYEELILPLGADGDFLTQQLQRAVALRDLERSGAIKKEVWTEGRYKDA